MTCLRILPYALVVVAFAAMLQCAGCLATTSECAASCARAGLVVALAGHGHCDCATPCLEGTR